MRLEATAEALVWKKYFCHNILLVKFEPSGLMIMMIGFGMGCRSKKKKIRFIHSVCQRLTLMAYHAKNVPQSKPIRD
jgi:uncharacterized integral membrane protein